MGCNHVVIIEMTAYATTAASTSATYETIPFVTITRSSAATAAIPNSTYTITSIGPKVR
jgi:hypothetical protein